MEQGQIDFRRSRVDHPFLWGSGSPEAASMQCASNIAASSSGYSVRSEATHPRTSFRGISTPSGRVWETWPVKLRSTTDASPPVGQGRAQAFDHLGVFDLETACPAVDGRGQDPAGVQGEDVVLMGQVGEQGRQQNVGERTRHVLSIACTTRPGAVVHRPNPCGT
ncbi:hypothetical protein [Nocardiopsis salina]|uniref:hypothetical protein n=1 Tax=Nocardiopsis salina TaxID=245836 RepID=UPI00036595A7